MRECLTTGHIEENMYSGGSFMNPFLHGPFFARFLLVRKSKKGTVTGLGPFSTDERNISLLNKTKIFCL